MKKKIVILFICALLMIVTGTTISCTENIRARAFGGNITLNLPAGEKLVNATWKDADLWYLTRTMNNKDSAETYSFKENSTYGVLEGKITFIEHKR